MIRKGFYGLVLAVAYISCGPSYKAEQEEKSMITRDIHSFANIDEVQIKHLFLDLSIDFDKHILEGKATLDLAYVQPVSVLILDALDLQVEKVEGPNKEPLDFKRGKLDSIKGSSIIVSLIGQPESVTIFYRTSENAAALQWMDASQTVGKRHPAMFSQSQAILARSWVPLQDCPLVRFTYEAKIRTKPGMMVLMSAENPTKLSSDGSYSFQMKQPIPSYLMAIAAGDYQFQSISDRAGIYAEPESLAEAAKEFSDLENMIQAAENLFGPYAWEQYDLLVLPPSFPFGGMENPRLTFLTPSIIVGDQSLTSLVAHELAHSWSGNLVTNATWNDFWLNEGFTVYFERRIMEALYGKDFSDMLSVIGYGDLKEDLQDIGPESADTWLKLDLADRNPDDGLTNVAYEKGYFFLLHVEAVVGRAAFDSFLKNYFKTFAFKSVNTDQFLDFLLSDLCNGDRKQFEKINPESWIYAPGLPSSFNPPTSSLLVQAEDQAEAFIKGEHIKEKLEAFNPFQHIHFLRALEPTMSLKQAITLDEWMKYSEMANPEIRVVWLSMVLEKGYQPAYFSASEFLQSTGRRKFLMPIYKALIVTEQGKIIAKDTYQKARSGYHFVAIESIDKLLLW